MTPMDEQRYVARSPMPVPARALFDWHARPGAFERLNPPFDPVEVLERSGGLAPGARTVLRVHLGPVPRRAGWRSTPRWTTAAPSPTDRSPARSPAGSRSTGCSPTARAAPSSRTTCSYALPLGLARPPRRRLGPGEARGPLRLPPRAHRGRPRPPRRAARPVAPRGHHRLARAHRQRAHPLPHHRRARRGPPRPRREGRRGGRPRRGGEPRRQPAWPRGGGPRSESARSARAASGPPRPWSRASSVPSRRPAVLINGSAMGFYGDRGDTPVDESVAARHRLPRRRGGGLGGERPAPPRTPESGW